MAMGSLEDHILEAVRRLSPAVRLDGFKATILRAADKCDPLNLRAVIVAEASVGGHPCAWIVECPNDGTQAVEGRLIGEVANSIAAAPNQLRSAAEANKMAMI